MKRRVLSLLITVAMVLTLLPPLRSNVNANYTDSLSAGDFEIISVIDLIPGTDFSYESNVLTILSSKEMQISGTTTKDRIVIASDVDANITLAGVSIDVSAVEEVSAFSIADNSTGDVTLTLASDSSNFFKSGSLCAGIQKNGLYSDELGTLTIKSEVGDTGSLEANGGKDAAGIGGARCYGTSKITFESGRVTAKSYDCDSPGTLFANEGFGGAAGIGGGSYGGVCSHIVINGGDITAIGGNSILGGAGIGSGNAFIMSGEVTCNDITINGGTVTAIGGSAEASESSEARGGAGIGSGEGSGAENISITGGYVTAVGGDRGEAVAGYGGAGIGGGCNGYASKINISGGTINVNGGSGAAGIGGGFQTQAERVDSSSVVISGGSVKAVGSSIKQEEIEYTAPTIGNGISLVDTTYISGAPIQPTLFENTNIPSYLVTFDIGEAFVEAEIQLQTYDKITYKSHPDDTKLYFYVPPMRMRLLYDDEVFFAYPKSSNDVSFSKVEDKLVVMPDDMNETLIEGEDYKYPDATGVLTILSDKPMTITGTTTTDSVSIAAGVDADVTLAGVNIDVSAFSNSYAFSIADSSTGHVKVTLADGTKNILKSANGCAGLQYNSSRVQTSPGSLTIEGDTGELIAIGGVGGNEEIGNFLINGGSGIGAGAGYESGDIIINGGKIRATGNGFGLGIGGYVEDNYLRTDITINGGDIVASGGIYSFAAIGGNGSKVTIYDGKINAIGGTKNCAGIGSGFFGAYSKCDVTIHGGDITAKGGDDAAGIGSSDIACNVTINGGKIHAEGGKNAAGIGNRNIIGDCNVNIAGGDITAIGGSCSSGIGGQEDNITLTGGTITSSGGARGYEEVYDIDGNIAISPSASLKVGTICNPKDLEGKSVFCTTLDTGRDFETTQVSINEGELKTYKPHPNDRKLYFYMPEGEYNAKCDGIAYSVSVDTDNAENVFEIRRSIAITSTNSEERLIEGEDYTYPIDTRILTILSDKAMTITEFNNGAATMDRVVIKKDVSANITLAGIHIDVSQNSRYTSAFLIEDSSTGNVTITIQDGTVNTLVGGLRCAGLQKNGADKNVVGTLTIQGNGQLDIKGGTYAAGIGGGNRGVCSNVVINSGVIRTTGGYNGSGIGGGLNGDSKNIIINGGTITAIGNTGGAGIGNGTTINGGIVNANGGSGGGAGIGGCKGYKGNNIVINGGSITSIGGGGAAGIGGSFDNECSDILITGGSVKAVGSVHDNNSIEYLAASIGSGVNYDLETDSYSDGISVFPTTNDRETHVYLTTLDIGESFEKVDISLNEKTAQQYFSHPDDTKLYFYLPVGDAVAEYVGKQYKENVEAYNGNDFEETIQQSGRMIFRDSIDYDIPLSQVGRTIDSINVLDGISGEIGALTFSATGLPEGIAISTTGIIFGTPTKISEAGIAIITVKDSNTPVPTQKSISISYGAVIGEEEAIVESPVINPMSGTFNSVQRVTITCATTGSAIYYTMDGSEPTINSTKYNGVIEVDSTAILKARAFKSGMNESRTVKAEYIIHTPRPTETPEPSESPKPSELPKPSNTPKPSDGLTGEVSPVVQPPTGTNTSNQKTSSATVPKKNTLTKVRNLITKAGRKKIVITWKKMKGAKKYQVFYSKKKKGKYFLAATVKKTTYSLKKKAKWRKYYIKIRAVSGNKKGPFSSIKRTVVNKKKAK